MQQRFLFSCFRNFRIRTKLLVSYSTIFALSMSIGFMLIYYVVRINIEDNIERELNNTTNTILNLVKTSATVSIKNYLTGVAEKNYEIVGYFHGQYQNGKLDLKTAQKMASEVLLSQTIGDTGYIYCLDSEGTVVVHPSRGLVSTNVSEYDFVKKMMLLKKGYLEYNWKNLEEEKARPKALYMLHFKPWDWIISVSTYRSEFKELINVADFRKSVLDLDIGNMGYSFVIDGQGNAVIHPKLEGVNIFEADDLPNEFLEEMLGTKTGEIRYTWKNPGEKQARQKLSIYNYLPEYDWIVGSSSYQDEFYEPLLLIRNLILGIFFVTLLMVLGLTYTLSTSITSPLKTLINRFSTASFSKRMFTIRMEEGPADEIVALAKFFHQFMDQLEKYDQSLRKEISERRQIENSLRESQGRYRSIMAAAADPIVVYEMAGEVNYCNPAFERVFGWKLKDCIGREIDHFIPEENLPEWEETRRRIKKQGSLAKSETKRYTQQGDIRDVSLSGAVYLDQSKLPAGMVVIYRDVTEKRRLSKHLLDVGDTVRQKIGQDLHDDLCPHLIGTAGLAAVLADNLSSLDEKNSDLAKKIVIFIDEAIEKSKVLSRGLCPVHLAAHGLESAINEIALRVDVTTAMRCRVAVDDDLEMVDNLIVTHLYYIVQEAVNNSVKHSKGSVIAITITKQEGDVLHLTVKDDGCGIDEQKSKTGMGLQIMRYRAGVIDAVLDIETDPQNGTTINVVLKLAE